MGRRNYDGGTFSHGCDVGEVVDIEDSRPHLAIHCLNCVHVIPVSVIEAKISGSLPLVMEGQEAEDSQVLRAILAEWLLMIS